MLEEGSTPPIPTIATSAVAFEVEHCGHLRTSSHSQSQCSSYLHQWWVRRGGWAACTVAALTAGFIAVNAWIPLMRWRSDSVGTRTSPPVASGITSNDSAVYVMRNGSAITLVCEMSAEIGNILGFLAYCTALAAHMKTVHEVDVELVPRPVGGDNEHVKSSRQDVHACFPRLYQLNVVDDRTRGFDDELEERRTTQERWGINLSGIDAAYEPAKVAEKVLAHVARRVKSEGVTHFPNGTITLPFLVTKAMLAYDHNDWLDRYFYEIRERLEFDAESCCALKPYPDETVFHLRNFKAELLPNVADEKGFKELGPRQTAQDLLGHLRPGDKVAVLSRFSSDEVQQYVSAMRDRGLEVRFIDGQTARQDFCFLLSTRKELVGVSISTYFYWAARLSNASRVVTYSLDIPSQWGRAGHGFFQYNYTHPGLVGGGRQWVFRLIQPDESPNATLGRTVVVGAESN